jgi:hypothetical protein
MQRSREFNVLAVGLEARSCDEWPLVPDGVEPQVDISRNTVPEPFFHVFDHDTVIVGMAGSGRVDLHDTNVLWEPIQPGDFVYIPAGAPSRIVPDDALLTIRFTGDARARQTCAWFCEQCGVEQYRFTWDATTARPQNGFIAATGAYAQERAGVGCDRCGAAMPALDLSSFRWAELAAQLHDQTQADGVTRVDTPIPAPSKLPIRVNVFERLQIANVQLVPLFPYLGDGAIMPGAALFRGQPGVDVGSFYHQNSVDEVGMTFASHDAWSPTGAMWVNGPVHPVTSPLADPGDPDSFCLMVITQRQPQGEATEAMMFRCVECKHLLFKREYDATPSAALEGVRFPLFASQTENVQSIAEFNESHRVCSKCGTENPEFPIEHWGAGEYASRGETANRGYDELAKAVRELQPT